MWFFWDNTGFVSTLLVQKMYLTVSGRVLVINYRLCTLKSFDVKVADISLNIHVYAVTFTPVC